VGGEVRAILLKEMALWLIQWDLERRYGLLLAFAILALRIGRTGRSTQYYCLGATLIVVVYLAQR
jgi:hypothetical protein